MKSFLTALAILIFLSANVFAQTGLQENNKELAKLFESYGMEYIARHPVFATSIGYNSFDSLLPVEFTDRYVIEEKAFFTKYLTGLSKFNREDLTDDDRLSYDIFKWNHTMALEGLTYKDNRIPFNQFGGIPFDIGQLGSGTVIQPFKTVKDYNNWISRATAFSAWADSAIVYFQKGMAEGVVLPKALVVKMVPQMESFITSDPTKSIFYGPVNNFPKEFNDSAKLQLTNAYIKLITEQLVAA